MAEENNQIEETEAQPTAEEISPAAPRRRFLTGRNAGISFGLLAVLLAVAAIIVVVSYRYGVFDNYIKQQFVAKMTAIGIVFDADVFRLSISPLQLELKNAVFNDRVSGEKLFYIRDAKLGLTVQNLYAWQLTRDIKLDSTEINGAEAWVKFDANGKSNFSNLVEDNSSSRVNFKYDSVKFTMRDGIVHFGDAQHKIAADAKNILFFLEPAGYAASDEQKRYNFDVTSTQSKFIYDEHSLEPLDLHAKGIADDLGAEISEFKLTTPIGESTLNGKLTDWKNLNYDFNINSTVDLTQTSNLLPIGTPLRGAGNFNGKVTGEGANYKIDGQITADSLSASNIYLRALNVIATVEGKDSVYEANGKAVADLLTFEDFRIEFPKISGNVRGTGTDFKWLGELQAVAAKTPSGTLGGLYLADAAAEYKDKNLSATVGSVRLNKFAGDGISVENLQTRNAVISNGGGVTNISAPNARLGALKTKAVNLNNLTANDLKVKDAASRTDLTAKNLQLQSGNLGDTKLNGITANGANLVKEGRTVTFDAQNLRAQSVDANGASIGEVTADDLAFKDVPNETTIAVNKLKIAKVATNAAILGNLNIAGVRLSIRQGTIEGTSGDINAGDVALVKNANLPDGGKLESVKLSKPVFVLEPSGRYRATADMSLGGGTVGSVSLGAAKAVVAVNNDQVALTDLSADVMGGKLNGAAAIAFNNRNRSNVNVNFSSLDLGKLLALQGGRVIPVEGETTGKVDLSFSGTNFKTASGSLTADIAANAGTAERGLIPVTGRVEAAAANGLFSLGTARLNTDKSSVAANGSFDLSGDASNLNIALNSTDAGEIDRIVRVLDLSPEYVRQTDEYKAELAGNLTFSGTLTGSLTNPTINGSAALDSLRLRGRDLGSLKTDVVVSPTVTAVRNGVLQEPNGGGNLAFSVEVPSVGTNNIVVQATLNKLNTGNLLAALPVDTLPAQLQDFQAQTSGTINITGLPGAAQGSANVTSGAGTIGGQSFDGFTTKANFAGTSVVLENFEAKFGDGSLKAHGNYQTDTNAFDFDAAGTNISLARIKPFISNGLPDINGTLNLTAKATGKADDTKSFNVNFNGTGNNIAVGGNSFGAVTFNGATENQQLNANLTATVGGQAQTIAANVNFADTNLPFRAETTFDKTELAPFIALARPTADGDVEITGTATGKVLLAGNLSSLDAQGNRSYSAANLSGSGQFSQLALQVGDTPIAAAEPVSVRFNTREVVVENAKFAGGGSNLVISGTKALTGDGMNNLAVDGSVNLSIFNAVSKNAFFAGLANVSVRLTGPNSTARLNGAADLKNSSAAIFVSSERLTLERINGRILFTTNQAQIDQLTGFLGGGKITASGGALLDGLQLQRFRFNINGNNITAPLPADFVTTGDAQIELTGFREAGVMNTLIAGSISAKRSVYTRDIDLANVVSGRRSSSLSEGGGDSSSILGIPKLDIRIEGRDALTVRNNVADLTASLSLRVTGDTDFPQISGRITANNGTILFNKNRYEVQRGVLEFPPGSGEINPFITLQAESEIKGYQIFVNVVGDLADTSNLNATVRSNPALPQADVVSLITTGNLANTDTGIPTLAQSGINTAAEILTDTLINNPARKATDKLFGLNVFEIDPVLSGQRLNPTARLTVGRQINKNLLVTYSTNLSGDQNQVLALEYRVSNKLSFVAQYEKRSLSNVTQRENNFSFEVRLKKRF